MPLSFGRATADFSQEGFRVANAIDGNPQTDWAISPQVGKDHAATFEIKEEVKFAGGATADDRPRSAVRRRSTRSASSAWR